MKVILSGRVFFYGPRASMIMDPLIVTDPAASMIGLVWLCVSAFSHCHYFWPYRNRMLCSYGKVLSLIAGVILLFAALTIMWKK